MFTYANCDKIQLQESRVNNGYYFAVTLNDDSEAIGYVGVDKTGSNPEMGKIGYVINKSHWGFGYGPAAIKAATDYVLENTEIKQIMATIKPENTRSRRCIEKAGYIFTKRLDNYVSQAAEDKSKVRLLYLDSRLRGNDG